MSHEEFYMDKDNSPSGSRSMADAAAERKPVGSALTSPDRKDAPGQAGHEKTGHEKVRNPDAELHFEKEAETLYEDGLDIKESSDLLYGAHGTSWGMKP
jgi:hypothetical protein